MKNKKNIPIILFIVFLVILIVFLFIILLLPDNKNIEEKYLIDSIDVTNNVVDISNINSIVNSVTPEVVEKLHEIHDVNNPEEVFQPEFNEDSDVDTFSSTNLSDHVFVVDEDYVSQYAEINYYPADCLQLINKNIVNTNLEIKENSEIPIFNQRDCYDTEGFFRLFSVYNKENNEHEDSIAINLETGDMFGLTKNGILYDYKMYEYNPVYIDEMQDIYERIQNGEDVYETIIPFDTTDLWVNIDKFVDFGQYPTKELKHITDESGTEYYKWTNSVSDDYLLIDYYSGEMFQVVNGEKSSEINAFK